VAATIAAQTAIWCVQERISLDDRDRARMLAENVLEAARAQPDLSEDWARNVKLPEDVLARWPKSTLKVAVETEHGLVRVNVEVSLNGETTAMPRPVALSAWFAPGRSPR
jgi:hypothetical protein